MYQILIFYFAVRFALEVMIGDIPETDIRKPCNCTMCSGIYILN